MQLFVRPFDRNVQHGDLSVRRRCEPDERRRTKWEWASVGIGQRGRGPQYSFRRRCEGDESDDAAAEFSCHADDADAVRSRDGHRFPLSTASIRGVLRPQEYSLRSRSTCGVSASRS